MAWRATGRLRTSLWRQPQTPMQMQCLGQSIEMQCFASNNILMSYAMCQPQTPMQMQCLVQSIEMQCYASNNFVMSNATYVPTSMPGVIDKNAMLCTQQFCNVQCYVPTSYTNANARSGAIDRNAILCVQQYFNVLCNMPTSHTMMDRNAKQCRASPHLTYAMSALSRAMQCTNLKHQCNVW